MKRLVWLAQPSNLQSTCPLNYQDSYHCPLCRHGRLSNLMLMDAFACNICNHIFAANLEQQSIQLTDSPQQLKWVWVNQRWQPVAHTAADPELEVWLLASALVVLPPVLLFLSYWFFPPLPHDGWFWFPWLWTALTLISHAALVLWLLLEHYQVPAYVSLKVSLQRWQGWL